MKNLLIVLALSILLGACSHKKQKTGAALCGKKVHYQVEDFIDENFILVVQEHPDSDAVTISMSSKDNPGFSFFPEGETVLKCK
ncbi:MAG: hypothetical protein JWM20_955 [Patescibacteria group bacterium]|nr:hypothetical protein [Patescibacteria group bacterium]